MLAAARAVAFMIRTKGTASAHPSDKKDSELEAVSADVSSATSATERAASLSRESMAPPGYPEGISLEAEEPPKEDPPAINGHVTATVDERNEAQPRTSGSSTPKKKPLQKKGVPVKESEGVSVGQQDHTLEEKPRVDEFPSEAYYSNIPPPMDSPAPSERVVEEPATPTTQSPQLVREGIDPSAYTRFHPDFEEDGDLTLISNDHVYFKTHALYWTSASCCAFSNLMQEHNVKGDSTTVADTLKMISGKMLPPLVNVARVKGILDFAELYQMQGVLSVLRLAINSGKFLQDNSLWLYTTASRLEWKEETKLASTMTLDLNLFDPIHAKTLSEIPAKELLALISFHEERKRKFYLSVQSTQWAGSCPNHSSGCPNRLAAVIVWVDRLINEMYAMPSGRTIGVESLLSWNEAKALAEKSRCPSGTVTLPGLPVADLALKVSSILKSLPESV